MMWFSEYLLVAWSGNVIPGFTHTSGTGTWFLGDDVGVRVTSLLLLNFIVCTTSMGECTNDVITFIGFPRCLSVSVTG